MRLYHDCREIQCRVIHFVFVHTLYIVLYLYFSLVDGAFSHPSLSVGTTRLESNAPAVLYFQGPASSDVYIQALRSVRYSNLKDRPTVGDRLIAVTIYDGTSTNAICVCVCVMH